MAPRSIIHSTMKRAIIMGQRGRFCLTCIDKEQPEEHHQVRELLQQDDPGHNEDCPEADGSANPPQENLVKKRTGRLRCWSLFGFRSPPLSFLLFRRSLFTLCVFHGNAAATSRLEAGLAAL